MKAPKAAKEATTRKAKKAMKSPMKAKKAMKAMKAKKDEADRQWLTSQPLTWDATWVPTFFALREALSDVLGGHWKKVELSRHRSLIHEMTDALRDNLAAKGLDIWSQKKKTMSPPMKAMKTKKDHDEVRFWMERG